MTIVTSELKLRISSVYDSGIEGNGQGGPLGVSGRGGLTED